MPRIPSPLGNIFCKFGKEAAVCLDKTIIYTRDAGGNVIQKKVESWLRDFLANMTSELPVSWQLCNIQKERIGWAALFKSHCTRPHPVMKKKRKNLYNVLLALAFVFLWLYYRKEMWRICDRFLKRKWKFLTENSIKGKLFI